MNPKRARNARPDPPFYFCFNSSVVRPPTAAPPNMPRAQFWPFVVFWLPDLADEHANQPDHPGDDDRVIVLCADRPCALSTIPAFLSAVAIWPKTRDRRLTMISPSIFGVYAGIWRGRCEEISFSEKVSIVLWELVLRI